DQRREAPHEDALPAENVSAPATEEQKPAVPEDERRNDPLQLALGKVKVRADRRQCDLHQRKVERVEEDDTAEDDEQQLLRRSPTRVVVEIHGCGVQALCS